MKKSRGVGFVALLLSVAACQNDSYDTGEGKYSLTQADFVEAHSNSDKAIDRIVTDDGDTFAVSPQPTASWITTADSTYRAILYYNKVDNGNVEPVSLSQVPVVTIRAARDFKVMKTDPVAFESSWMSKNGKYLNVGFYLKIGQSEQDSLVHSIGMACNEVRTNADGTSTSYIQLFHDQGGVPEYYSSKYYISMACSQFETDSVCMVINTYKGEVSHRFKVP